VIHKVRGDLWELRATHRKNPYRVLFYNPRGDLIVLLHFFHKKTDAILESDIQRAERRMEDDRRQRGW
jgi:phage-related protein